MALWVLIAVTLFPAFGGGVHFHCGPATFSTGSPDSDHHQPGALEAGAGFLAHAARRHGAAAAVSPCCCGCGTRSRLPPCSLLIVATSTTAAYAFARMRFRFKGCHPQQHAAAADVPVAVALAAIYAILKRHRAGAVAGHRVAWRRDRGLSAGVAMHIWTIKGYFGDHPHRDRGVRQG